MQSSTHLQEITLEDQVVKYYVKRSIRARHVRLEIRPDCILTITVPRIYRTSSVPELIKRKSRWILKIIQRLNNQQLQLAKISSRNTVSYLGRELKVIVCQDLGEKEAVSLEEPRLFLRLKSTNNDINSLLQNWYRQQAKQLLLKKAEEMSLSMGVSYSRLGIRNSKTRWGSCSPRRNINFNWHLIMAPEPVIDYVVVHELAHLLEMNHSARFWATVNKFHPDWQEHRRWLKTHGMELAAGLADY
jgi:predicted metal-dependent hydrolase